MTEPLHPSAYAPSPIINALKRDRDRPIVEMAGGRAWTGGDILDATSRLTQALQAAGVRNGARVALLAGNSVEVLLLHNAIGYAGGCLVAMHPMGSADDHLFAIEDAGVEALIYDPAKFAPRAAELRQRLLKSRGACVCVPAGAVNVPVHPTECPGGGDRAAMATQVRGGGCGGASGGSRVSGICPLSLITPVANPGYRGTRGWRAIGHWQAHVPALSSRPVCAPCGRSGPDAGFRPRRH